MFKLKHDVITVCKKLQKLNVYWETYVFHRKGEDHWRVRWSGKYDADTDAEPLSYEALDRIMRFESMDVDLLATLEDAGMDVVSSLMICGTE